MFREILLVFSPWDTVQVSDPQGLYTLEETWPNFTSPIFSERTFPLQANLMQIELWYNNRGPMHIEFILCDYLAHIIRLLPKK